MGTSGVHTCLWRSYWQQRRETQPTATEGDRPIRQEEDVNPRPNLALPSTLREQQRRREELLVEIWREH